MLSFDNLLCVKYLGPSKAPSVSLRAIFFLTSCDFEIESFMCLLSAVGKMWTKQQKQNNWALL